ncbi:MAG TPA: hypothetical protein VII30_03280 [Gemmatimonadaceae bacterium]
MHKSYVQHPELQSIHPPSANIIPRPIIAATRAKSAATVVLGNREASVIPGDNVVATSVQGPSYRYS